MARPMLQFIRVDRKTPTKRGAKTRRDDFGEIYGAYKPAKAAEQAARCSQCGVPFCQQGCPLSNNIPDWLMLAASDRLEEAYLASSATNNMPEICGRICPQDRLCEGVCVIEQSGHGTVTIGAVEKHLTDTAWEEGWVAPIAPPRERAQSAGIIGAGPAGLAAAEQLRRKGYQVTVYDRYDRGGGLLIYGIPGFKLEKHIVERRLAHLEAGGIGFAYNTEIGADISFADLRAKHDTVLIATGVYKPRALKVSGIEADGVIEALDYLTVDCVRTAIRQGAKSVTCLYRRDKMNMPGSAREVQNAEEEGVVFEWLGSPEEIVATKAGKVKAVRARRMKLGPADGSGRQAPQATDEQFELAADVVICALGFDPEDLPALWGEQGLTVNRWGAVRVDFATMMTGLEGVFAAGDIVRGGSLVVWAIKDGRDASEAMHTHMQALVETDKVAAE